MKRAPARHRAQQSTDAALDEDEIEYCWFSVAGSLLPDFIQQSRVAKHDQPRDPFIAFPCRVRHDRPSVLVCLRLHDSHGIVVGAVDFDHFGAFTSDRIHPRGRSIVGHVDARRAPGIARRARHGAAVIAFAGADQRRARPDRALL